MKPPNASPIPRPSRLKTAPTALQQVDRTYVRENGKRLSYFAGCDYYRLASHPSVLAAVGKGMAEAGLNVAASRRTTGNHEVYGRLEQALADYFQAAGVILVANGYLANFAAAQGLAGEFTHVLLDDRSHSSLMEASLFLQCPVLRFRHLDPAHAVSQAATCGPKARLALLTDGVFAHSGAVAPLQEYQRRLPGIHLILDDAHGAGVLGARGRGTVEFAGLKRERLVQTLTLSKAFGVYGGAVLGSARLRQRIEERSRAFAGATPFPLPLAYAAIESIRILDAHPDLRRRLLENAARIREGFRRSDTPVAELSGPIIALQPKSHREAARLCRGLRARGIHPPLLNYLGTPAEAYFRFVISSEHTASQLEDLIAAWSSLRPQVHPLRA